MIKGLSIKKLSRGVLLATSLVMASAGVSAQSSEPVSIGMVFPKQGPSAALGEYLSRGAYLAAEQRDNKVMGRDLEIIFLDEPNPQVAQQNFQKLVDENRVAGVVAGNSSAAALAIMSVAQRNKVPLVVPGAAAREITGESCNRYTFRFQATVPVQMKGIMPHVMEHGKDVYFLTPSYAFGQDMLKTGREMVKAAGGNEVGFDEVPLNTADYSSYVLKIRAAKPDVVIGGLIGQDLSSFLKSWNEMGMQGRIPFVEIAVSDTDFWDVGPDASTGTYVKPWYYNDPNNNEAEKEFVDLFMEKYDRPPSDKAYAGWISMRSLLDSIESANSTNSEEIVDALEKWQDPIGTFPSHYRDWDHQLIRPSVILKIKENITDQWDYFDVLGYTSEGEEATLKDFGTKEEVACEMNVS